MQWCRKKPSSLFLLMKSIRVIKLAGALPVPWHLWSASYTSHFARCLNKSFPVTLCRELNLFNSGLQANTSTIISLLNNSCIAFATCCDETTGPFISVWELLVLLFTYFFLVRIQIPSRQQNMLDLLTRYVHERTNFLNILATLSIRHRSMAPHNITILTGSSV